MAIQISDVTSFHAGHSVLKQTLNIEDDLLTSTLVFLPSMILDLNKVLRFYKLPDIK